MNHKTQPTAHAEITAPISADLRGIGALAAPAAQQDALLLAMHLRQRAKLATAGIFDTLCMNAANVLAAQHERIAEMEAQPARECLQQSAARATARETHFFIAGWNGVRQEVEANAHFNAALQAAPPAPECGNCFEGKSDLDHACRKCGGSRAAAPAQAVAVPTDAQPPEQWIDDPHDIEQGVMLNPEWVRAQEHATQLAGQGLEASVTCALDEAKNNRCKCGAGTLMDCLSENCDVVRARAAAPVQAQEDARDAARLDYLQEQGATVELVFGGEGCSFRFRVGGLYAAAHQDLRDAIDAAMAAGGAT